MLLGILGMAAAAIGLWLLRVKQDRAGYLPLRPACADALIYLRPGANQKQERRRLWKNKLRLGLYVLLGGSLLITAAGLLQHTEDSQAVIREIERPEPGKGAKEVSLSVWTEQEEIPLTIHVGERVPEQEEAEKALDKSCQILREQLRGDNASLDEVNQPLRLPGYVEETSCQVYWYTDNPERIDRNGIVYTDGLEQKEYVTLTAEISLAGYEREYSFSVGVIPKEMDERERLVSELKHRIEKAEKEGEREAFLELPAEIGEQDIVYRSPGEEQGGLLWALTGILAMLSMLLPEQRLLQEKKKKEEQLMLAYPEIVSKLCLLIGSGMTVRTAWERIVKDYRSRRETNYAYEEMLFTFYELERGLPEGRAYAAFGRRCRIRGYRKLGSLLEQNLKKGTAGLLALLQEETGQAFEERRAFAVKLAQEAGTRMLLPMILLLAVVLIICIAPAVMSF